MKHLLSILCLIGVTSCMGLQSTEGVPKDGNFVILQYSEPGTVVRSWHTSRYSYQINEFQ
jgi:hypothetical protein